MERKSEREPTTLLNMTFDELGIDPEEFRQDLIRLLSTSRPKPPDDQASIRHWVLWHRAKLAGLDVCRSHALADYLPGPDLADICELVEAGCPLSTAVRIVL
jgi:hypothetical protein